MNVLDSEADVGSCIYSDFVDGPVIIIIIVVERWQ